jgi:hypothetical protein
MRDHRVRAPGPGSVSQHRPLWLVTVRAIPVALELFRTIIYQLPAAVTLCAQYRYAGSRGCDRRYEVISRYSGRELRGTFCAVNRSTPYLGKPLLYGDTICELIR